MLTEVDIRRLAAAGEKLEVELKGDSREPLRDQDLIEAVVCLANGPGGTLIVGVEDDGQITGARPRHGSMTDVHRLQALISNNTVPAIAATAQVVPVGAIEVIAIAVPHARLPVGTARGRYLRRALGGDGRPTCAPFYVGQSIGAGMAMDPSAAIVPGASWQDLDPLEIERLRRLIQENPGRADRGLADLSDVDIAKALGVVEANGDVRSIRRAGLLLFGRESALRAHVPTHEVAWQVLRGQEVAANDFFRWPLLRVFEEILGKFRARNSAREVLDRGVRIEIPDVPEDGFREAFANALIHRDYTLLSAVHVQWRDDEVRIHSPGGFPEGVRIDNLIEAPPHPRNLLLADAFKRAGLVERTGRGVDIMFAAQLRYGRPPPNYELTTTTSVTVELPVSPPDLQISIASARRARAGAPLSVGELRVIAALRSGPRRMSELQELVGTDAAAAVLRSLIAAELVSMTGTGNAARVALAGDLATQAPAIDDRDNERRVLARLRKQGRITRAEVAELCGISLDQASRFLRKLIESNKKIRSVGRGRGAYYEWRGK